MRLEEFARAADCNGVLLLSAPDANPSSLTLLITTGSGIIVMVAKAIFDEVRRRGERKAAAEEKAALRKFVSELLEDRANHVAGLIEENTQISRKAFSEANAINLKIAALAGDEEAVQAIARRALLAAPEER